MLIATRLSPANFDPLDYVNGRFIATGVTMESYQTFSLIAATSRPAGMNNKCLSLLVCRGIKRRKSNQNFANSRSFQKAMLIKPEPILFRLVALLVLQSDD